MARNSLKIVGAQASVDTARADARAFLNEASAANAPVPSHPLMLQDALLREFSEDAPVRWPAPVRAVVIVGSAALLWGAIAGLIALV